MQNILHTIMLSAKLVNSTQVSKYDTKQHGSPMQYLLQQCHCDETAIAQTLANYYDYNIKPLHYQQLAQCHWQSLLQHPLRQWQCIPVKTDNQLSVYLADANNLPYIDHIKYHYGNPDHIYFCAASQLNNALCHIEAQTCYWQTYHQPNEDHIITLSQRLLNDAISKQASDIHIEPKQNHTRLRFRVDGLLYPLAHINHSSHQPLISRLKVLSQLDISEQRKPQDGRFQFKAFNQQPYDCRISTCPNQFGEKAVIRIGQAQQMVFPLSQVGLLDNQLHAVKKCKQQHHGLILVTGPTGSGKTQTLYSLLDWLNDEQKNICTIENPIEVTLPYLNQSRIQPQLGLTFNSLLRTLLRQDPDIIMLGEIRDSDTAMTAIKAAQTGHLVLSTLHTNNCIETLIRLQQFNIPLHCILNTLRLVIAQRLVRKLCPYCHHQDNQCQHCHQGYSGRRGLFETLPINGDFRQFVSRHGLDKDKLHMHYQQTGMQTLTDVAQQLINDDITDQTEIKRVVDYEN